LQICNVTLLIRHGKKWKSKQNINGFVSMVHEKRAFDGASIYGKASVDKISDIEWERAL
jgi:hypothetical protein